MMGCQPPAALCSQIALEFKNAVLGDVVRAARGTGRLKRGAPQLKHSINKHNRQNSDGRQYHERRSNNLRHDTPLFLIINLV